MIIGCPVWNNLEELLEVKQLLARGKKKSEEDVDPKHVVKKGTFAQLVYKFQIRAEAVKCYHSAYEILTQIESVDVNRLLAVIYKKYNEAYTHYQTCIDRATNPDVLFHHVGDAEKLKNFPETLAAAGV